MADNFFDHLSATTSSYATTSSKLQCAPKFDHEPTSAVAVIEGLTMIVIFLASLFTNLMAIVAIATDRALRGNLHNWLIVNLIVNDFGITIFSMLLSIISVFDNGCLLAQNPGLCAIHGAGATAFTFGNFATIVAISVDRYLTVVFPRKFPPTKTRIIAFIVACWVLPFANALPPLLNLLSDYKYHSLTHHCSPVWEVCTYYLVCVVILFGVTIPVMTACYAAIVVTLGRQERRLRAHKPTGEPGKLAAINISRCEVSYAMSEEGMVDLSLTMDTVVAQRNSRDDAQDESSTRIDKSPTSTSGGVVIETGSSAEDKDRDCGHGEGAEGGQGDLEMQKTVERKKTKKMKAKNDRLSTEKRLALTGFLLVMTTVICWTPYSIVHSCFAPIPRAHRTHSLGVFTMWLAYTNSLLDPLIYSFLNRKVRARYAVMFRTVKRAISRRLGVE